MARTLTTAMSNAVDDEVVRPFYLIHLNLDSGDGGALYFWSGVGNYSYDSKSYIGAGNLLNISTIQETAAVQANGLRVGLSGVNSSLITAARDADYQGRVLTLKLGLMDATNTVISDPVILFEGFMDVMSITDKGEKCDISVSVEHRLIEFDRERIRRLTDADQQIDHSGDKGFEFIAEIQEKEIAWGVHDGSKPTYGTGAKVPDNVVIPQINF